MKENFENKFMEIQEGLISLCLELTESKVDKIFVYASMEAKTTMFDAFFVRDGKVLTTNLLGIDKKRIVDFLGIGIMDLLKIRSLCEQNETQTPSEIKMFYDVKSHKFNADYKYGEICSYKTGLSSSDVFTQWYNEIKEQIE
ncbi:MAG: hypothetical protein LBM69_07395 [Lachnospiraceae bacterium]|jgi:hypothetical protein|nr:hypothetical protein [Lachnospiraceae bacterium]